MIRHEVVCNRCGKVWPIPPSGMAEEVTSLGWLVGSCPMASGDAVVHLCPPCYQSWMNWWKNANANGVSVPSKNQNEEAV